MNQILDNRNYYIYEEIESIRKQLLESNEVIPWEEYGAGKSSKFPKYKRQISDLANNSLAPAKYARLLHRLSLHFSPAITLELGTCLGITTLYLAKGNSQNKVISIEANGDCVKIARKNIDSINASNIHLIQGTFSEQLPEILKSHPIIDFVFLDGDHKYLSTINYVNQLLPNLTDSSVLILDDIHWSPEMNKAWEYVKQIPKVTVTIDLFRMGLVFFHKGQSKEHFTLRF
jgi:predicted O-methyltransferase YrrM